MIITIDGPAGTGKSTVAQGVAEELSCFYLDTGAMYRAFALYTLSKGIEEDRGAIQQALVSFQFEVIPPSKGEGYRYKVGGEEVSSQLHREELSQAASKISVHPFVRDHLHALQRAYAKEKGRMVAEGRDVGSVVFPHAEAKFYLTAPALVRASRALQRMKERGAASLPSSEEMIREVQTRDRRDQSRAHSPLICPKGAKEIDTSLYTAKEVISQIVTLVRSTA